MKRMYLAVMILSLGLPLYAQGPGGSTRTLNNDSDVSRVEIFGGYSYLNFDTNDGFSNRQNVNGWYSGTSLNITNLFAVEGEVDGYYKTFSANFGPDIGTATAKFSDYAFMAGPRVNFRPVFFHALLGMDHLKLTGTALGSSVSGSENSLAAALGGGIQLKVSSRLAVRPSVDYLLTRHGYGGPAMTQNNIRAAVGIVYSF